MRASSHSPIAHIANAVSAWRQRLGSREAVAVAIVETHEQLGFDNITGIHFERHRDTYQQAKNWADRIFRWLDDFSKDTTLLTVNMLPSILAAMPVDLRLQAVSPLLIPAGLSVGVVAKEPGKDGISSLVQRVITENSHAASALVGLLDGFDQAELMMAHRELLESRGVNDAAISVVESMLTKEMSK